MRDITNELRLATVDYADAFIDEGLPSLCDRAADEIDRLRAALATAQADRDAARAEIAHERLRYDGMRSDRDDWRQRAEQAQAEVAQAERERDEAWLELERLTRWTGGAR